MLRIRTRRVAEVPVVAVRVWLVGGERNSAAPGAACFAGRMLDEGSGRRDWHTVSLAAEARGISIATAAGYEVLALAIDGPAEELDRIIAWAAELSLDPAFAPDRWEWQQQLAYAELEALRDEPQALTGVGFSNQLYGDHPRGRLLTGGADDIARLSIDESRQFHRQAAARGPIVVVSGDIDEATAEHRVAEAFSVAAVAGVDAEALYEPPPAVTQEARRVVELPGDQAHLLIGRRTVARDHADLPALELAAVILGAGSGLAGRIPERVREREGLAYTASADTAAGASRDAGKLALYAATAPDLVERAELAMREELERFVADGPSADEVADARRFLVGQDVFRRESARQWADLLIEAEYTGLSVDSPTWAAERWAGLTVGDVAAASRRWLDPGDLVVTVGLPAGPAG